MLWASLILINGAGFVGSMPPAGSPENITIMFLSPSSVKVSWTTSIEHVDKYDVTYKPTDARVVAVVAGNSDSVTLSGLLADTQYQITVSAVREGKKYKSRPIVFRTLEPPRTNEVQLTPPGARSGGQRGVPPFTNMPPTYIQVRGVEVAIVVLVLMVWVAAIILFFNRWGKIRMLLPYQPDYKDTQLKVPGTGACSGTNACPSQQGNTFCCSQRHLHQCGLEETPGWRTRLSRSRINSAVYIPNSSAECDPLVPADCAVSLRRAKSAGNLQGQHHDLEFQRQDSEFQRQDSEFERQDSDVFKPESDTSGHNHFELPVLSISVATEKPFVEQHL